MSTKTRKATTARCEQRWVVGAAADGRMGAGPRGGGGRPVSAPRLIKGGYLFLPGNNGMQTGGDGTIKRHFLVGGG